MSQNKLSYRPEIDGLRAIAVISVILYHAKIVILGRDWFEGGFIGVDIFFVISGYLITRIVLHELQTKNSFNFLIFYERRARRILPMLFLVLLLSFAYGFFNLLPNEAKELARSGLAAIFFSSNFYFYEITTAYGAESSLRKPFLHTWSLGVEEQFYIFFPGIAYLVFRYFKAHFLTLLIAFSLLSLQFSEFMQVRNPELNFYFPLSRFWEIAIGALLAYRELNYKPIQGGFANQVLPITGLYLVACGLFYFDGKTPHPGFFSMIPVLGVALIIAFASGDELVGKILGSKPLVIIGLISFSAYLWHFPIYSFAKIEATDLSNYDKVALLVLILILSLVSFKFIEQPTRKKISPKSLFWALGLTFFALISLASFIGFSKDYEKTWTKYSSTRLVDSYFIIKDTQQESKRVEAECIFNIFDTNNFDGNLFNSCRKKFGQAVFVLGDSHGENVFNMFSYSERFPFVIGLTQGSCRPHGCTTKFNHYEFFKKLLPIFKKGDAIVFHQSGSHLISDSNGLNDSQLSFDTGIYTIDYQNINKVVAYLNSIAQQTQANVFWLGPFLEYRFNPKKIVQLARANMPYEKYLKVNSNSPKIFNKIEAILKETNHIGYEYVSFKDFFDVEHDAIITTKKGNRCFRFKDRDHFSECGEIRIGQLANYRFTTF
jgi:peptidoglycan/LPS O-acetylase OafA/YrhL